MDYEELIKEIKDNWESKSKLRYQLLKISRLLWQLSSEIANSELTEMDIIIRLKEEGYKMSFIEAEAKAKIETGNVKRLKISQYSSLQYLFEAVREKIEEPEIIFSHVESRTQIVPLPPTETDHD